MKFSTQNLLSIRDWQTHAEVYQNAVTECRLAGELGFDVVWLADHHFSHFMGAFSRGGLAHDKVIRSMRLFAEKVIPKVR